ncbi:MAG: hypothetical protein J2P50_02345 [Hyphomicrobiaceae bacterium]|nr:hypothetical protein [Hyphomicrobiaceae bacterium]
MAARIEKRSNMTRSCHAEWEPNGRLVLQIEGIPNGGSFGQGPRTCITPSSKATGSLPVLRAVSTPLQRAFNQLDAQIDASIQQTRLAA